MSKPTLILVGGLLSDESVWNHQIQHCQDIANIIIPNWSQAPTLDGAIDIILANAPTQFVIVGHSQGGVISLEVALRYPERVIGLCVLNTKVCADSPEKITSRIAMIKSTQNGTFPEIARQCAINMVYVESLTARVEKMFLGNEQMLINQQNIMLQRRDILPLLKQIKCPSLVIHASKDKWFVLDDAKQIVNAIPNCKLAVVEDCGHMSMLEQPITVSALISFWLSYY